MVVECFGTGDAAEYQNECEFPPPAPVLPERFVDVGWLRWLLGGHVQKKIRRDVVGCFVFLFVGFESWEARCGIIEDLKRIVRAQPHDVRQSTHIMGL